MGLETNSKNRISWVNGLKGLACLAVFCHHFVLSFYPATYYGTEVESKTISGFDTLLSYKPYGVILNGNFFVCLFIMISAFLFSVKTIRLNIEGKKEDLLNLFVKRYLRLMPPVALVSVIYYVLAKVLTLLNMNYTYISSELSVSELIQHILIYQWVTYDITLIGPLWCMYIIFVGSFIAVFLSEFSKRERWYMPLLYLVISGALMFLNQYYLAVGLGVLAADLYCHKRIKLNKVAGYIVSTIFIIGGLFLGGYPSYVSPENPIYLLIEKLPGSFVLSHGMGAMLLILGLCIAPRTYVLSSKVFNYLGDISFGIYLIHTLIINFLSYYLTDTFAERTGNFGLSVLISFLITVALLIPLSIMFHYLFEVKLDKAIKKVKIK